MTKWLCLGFLAASALSAEVADAGPGGFMVKSAWVIKATPDDVYKSLMGHVGDWWNPAHTWSNDAHNLSIEPKVNGCFCEKLPNGGGVRHLQIIYLDPGKTIRFSGGLGPFQAMAVTGVLTVELKPDAGATTLNLTYTVGGFMREEPRHYAGMADGMLKEQFTRLQHFVETGSAVEKK